MQIFAPRCSTAHSPTATGLSGDELAAWLDDACEADATLRREVEALLRHASETRDQFAASLSAARERLAGGELADSAEAVLTGRRFGPYRIVRELGRGGMGRVFLAERDDAQYHGHAGVIVRQVVRERHAENRRACPKSRHVDLAAAARGENHADCASCGVQGAATSRQRNVNPRVVQVPTLMIVRKARTGVGKQKRG